MGQTIACANQKGGVGKTTTVVNLATYLALAGQRVLIIDLDSQGNATSGFGLDKSRVGHSVYEAVIGGDALADVTVASGVEGLLIVPASVALAGADVELAPVAQRERRLARLIAAIADDYDYIFLDCPPSLGLLTVNALTAADSVLIPIQCEYYALEGLTQLISTINLVRDHLNPGLAIKGAVLTMYDARTNLSSEVTAEVRRHLAGAVYDTVIPRSVRLSEAPSYGLPIALYRNDSRGAEAYHALAEEMLARDRLAHDSGSRRPGADSASGSSDSASGSGPGRFVPVVAISHRDRPTSTVTSGGLA
ncbi:MAG TPA: AAA family ATPase [Candidatus Saccharimonadales bacterium]|nr:AAA family ATPase [Candidatus Saccharimonadales bacterium]